MHSPAAWTTTRVASSRYVWIDAPRIAPERETWTCVNLPKRLELWLRSVDALPNASRSGFVCTSSSPSSMLDFDCPFACESRVTYARCLSTSLHVSVFPAPDGPDTMIACDSPAATSSRYIRSAMAKMCGGSDPIGRFRYCLI